jgi:phosphoribosylformylglycinamidine synthase II
MAQAKQRRRCGVPRDPSRNGRGPGRVGDTVAYDARTVQPVADLPLHRRLGLTDGELDRITGDLGRDPNAFELAVYSLLWSEHCGYKHSALLLRRLPTEGPRVLQGPGENAGVIDVGDGLAVAFKVESHNHPSAVEPFQGAATGVGGILRDIFAMGARPIAVLDSLRFGVLGSERTRRLFDGCVRGIGHYGNCVGVPNVGGEVVFEPGYESNCLVNAMCVGLLDASALQSARAAGAGNLVVLFGALTGRDGIGGASVLASQDLDEGDDSKRPSVQIGDPFTEKKLIECSLELVRLGLLVSLQDLGAAGLASATSEMASKGGVGLELDLDRVPVRETGMEPFEIMISESQERMAAVVEPARVDDVGAVCAKWDLPCTVIGRVVSGDTMTCRCEGEIVGELPVASLVDHCPRYPVHGTRPDRLAETPVDAASYPPPEDAGATLLTLLGAPNIASKAWVYGQYDQYVGSGSIVRPGADAGVVRLTPSDRAIAVALDGNGRRVWLDPRRGAAEAVCEAALNVACAGGEPAAITNCLNFGNPERGETPYMLTEAIEGLAEACEAFGIPVVSGNVSLYNETAETPIPPTPTVGCLGVLESASHAVASGFREPGDVILLLADGAPSLDGSEYQRTVFGRVEGRIPARDLAAAARTCAALAGAARRGLLRSAHDVSDGGLAVTLAEASFGLGCEVDLPDLAARADVTLFGEGLTAAVVSCAPEHQAALEELGAVAIGTVTDRGRIEIRCGATAIDLATGTAAGAHADTIPQAMAG